MEHVTALFTQSREVGANDGEILGACNGAKATGDFLLEFGHADIAFGLIIVEWHAQIGEKAQHVVRVLSQTDKQIDRRRLFDTPSAPWALMRGRIVAFTFAEDDTISATQVREPMPTDRATSTPGRIGFFFCRAQKIDHLARPRLSGGFFQIDELTQMVRITQPVGAVIFPIGKPAVVHRNALC